jgi:hypothetical protein
VKLCVETFKRRREEANIFTKQNLDARLVRILLCGTDLKETLSFQFIRLSEMEAGNGNIKLDDAIKSYLMKNGYQQAASMMDAEMRRQMQHGGGDNRSQPTIGEIPSFLLELYSREAKENVKFEDYKLLHEWIACSIDIVKPELLAINFPFFVLR